MEKYIRIKFKVVQFFWEDNIMKDIDITLNNALDKLPYELRCKLIEAKKNFNKLDEESTERLHDKISILVHHDNNQINGQYKVFTFLGQYIVDSFMLDLITSYNKYLSVKYDINDFHLKNLGSKSDVKKFSQSLSIIKEKHTRWLYNNFFKEQEHLTQNILLKSFDEVLRVKKISDNIIKDLEKRNINDDEFGIYLSESVYKLVDKLTKNDLIKNGNQTLRMFSNLYQQNKLKRINNDNIMEHTAFIKVENMKMVTNYKITAYSLPGCLKENIEE